MTLPPIRVLLYALSVLDGNKFHAFGIPPSKALVARLGRIASTPQCLMPCPARS